MRASRLAAATCTVALMAALTACGSATDDSSSSAGGTSTSSEPTTQPSPTSDAPTTEDTPTGDAAALTAANFAQEIQAAQASAGSAHMEATFSAAGQTGQLQGDFSGASDESLDSLAMNVSLDIAGQSIQMVLVDKVIYIKGAGMSTNAHKPWIKVDIGGRNNPFSSMFDSANPENFTAFLNGVTDMQDKGMETVDGVDTHHYAITVDTAQMVKQNDMFKGQDASGLGLPKAITTDVWVDGDNLPVEISVPLGKAGSVEAHFSQWGDHVSIEAPPSNQVMDMSKMMSAQS